VAIEDITLEDLPTGGVREMEEKDFFKQAKIEMQE
jgi:hypothetical protein